MGSKSHNGLLRTIWWKASNSSPALSEDESHSGLQSAARFSLTIRSARVFSSVTSHRLNNADIRIYTKMTLTEPLEATTEALKQS